MTDKLTGLTMNDIFSRVPLNEVLSDVKLMANDRFYTRFLNMCFMDFCAARFAVEVRAFMDTQVMQQIQYARAVALTHYNRESHIEHFIPELTLNSWGKLYADTEHTLEYVDDKHIAFGIRKHEEGIHPRILLCQEHGTRHMDGTLLSLEKYKMKKGSARELCQLSVFSGFEHALTWDACARDYEMNVGFFRNEAFPKRPHRQEWRTPEETALPIQVSRLNSMEDGLIDQWQTMMKSFGDGIVEVKHDDVMSSFFMSWDTDLGVVEKENGEDEVEDEEENEVTSAGNSRKRANVNQDE
jgi:hypothetical protein